MSQQKRPLISYYENLFINLVPQEKL
ncbi:hypothetical protein B4U80_07063 [Leptotrombidium deliense]|uniref:Uncharacterized protein n=1 Tax=Leptotrombidium deliense TaxID=299467 RepID=A0A443S1Q8_9ACAR|nr:hypothetical protein B4U80_07063 [Leptotrombidium deliense]